MLEFILASILTCQQAQDAIARLQSLPELPISIKEEIVKEIEQASDCN